MGVYSFRERGITRGGELRKEGRLLRRVFQALTNSRNDDSTAVLAHGNCPRYGQPHPTFSQAVVSSVRAEQRENLFPAGGAWDVTVDYDTQQFDGTDPEDPTQDIPEVDWSFGTVSVAHLKDAVSDVPVENSAGDPFDPFPERAKRFRILTIVRNELNFDSARAAQFVNHCNSSTFFGAPIFEVICADLSGRRVFERGWLFWKVTYQFYFDQWEIVLPQFVDQGFRERIQRADGVFEHLDILDPNGLPATSPQLLDGNGRKLAKAPGVMPRYIGYYTTKDADFSQLALENV